MSVRKPAADDADPEAVARAIVLRRLTVAPRTRVELARSLRDRAVPDDVAERVLDRFAEVGLVDDSAFATMFAESRRERSGWSRRAIAHKLNERGVARDTVAAVVESVAVEDEERTAEQLVRARWRRVASLAPEVRRRRLLGMLQRRGYGMQVALAAMATAERESGDVDR